MLLQAGAAHEALATVAAHERPFLSMRELVAQQVRAAAETSATLATDERSLACVDLLVPQQIASLAEYLATHVAAAASHHSSPCARVALAPVPWGMPASRHQCWAHTGAGILTGRVLFISWIAGEYEGMGKATFSGRGLHLSREASHVQIPGDMEVGAHRIWLCCDAVHLQREPWRQDAFYFLMPQGHRVLAPWGHIRFSVAVRRGLVQCYPMALGHLR